MRNTTAAAADPTVRRFGVIATLFAALCLVTSLLGGAFHWLSPHAAESLGRAAQEIARVAQPLLVPEFVSPEAADSFRRAAEKMARAAGPLLNVSGGTIFVDAMRRCRGGKAVPEDVARKLALEEGATEAVITSPMPAMRPECSDSDGEGVAAPPHVVAAAQAAAAANGVDLGDAFDGLLASQANLVVPQQHEDAGPHPTAGEAPPIIKARDVIYVFFARARNVAILAQAHPTTGAVAVSAQRVTDAMPSPQLAATSVLPGNAPGTAVAVTEQRVAELCNRGAVGQPLGCISAHGGGFTASSIAAMEPENQAQFRAVFHFEMVPFTSVSALVVAFFVQVASDMTLRLIPPNAEFRARGFAGLPANGFAVVSDAVLNWTLAVMFKKGGAPSGVKIFADITDVFNTTMSTLTTRFPSGYGFHDDRWNKTVFRPWRRPSFEVSLNFNKAVTSDQRRTNEVIKAIVQHTDAVMARMPHVGNAFRNLNVTGTMTVPALALVVANETWQDHADDHRRVLKGSVLLELGAPTVAINAHPALAPAQPGSAQPTSRSSSAPAFSQGDFPAGTLSFLLQ
jgi:hypothetical protein